MVGRGKLGAGHPLEKGMIMPNGLGTIDSDYRGELLVLATWIGPGEEFTINEGERIAQLFAKVPDVEIIEVEFDKLGETSRVRRRFWLLWTILTILLLETESYIISDNIWSQKQ